MHLPQTFCHIFVAAVCTTAAAPVTSAQSLQSVFPIQNGGFEETVASTSGGPNLLGGYWLGAEAPGMVIDSTDPEHDNVLVLHEGQHAMQRFVAYEYLTEGAGTGTTKYEGASDSTTINGQFLATNLGLEARVILEESRKDMDAAFWGFVTFPPPIPPATLPSNCNWSYRTRNTTSGVYSDMVPIWNASEYVAHWESAQEVRTQIRFESQLAVKAQSAIRVWTAPHAGRLLIQIGRAHV